AFHSKSPFKSDEVGDSAARFQFILPPSSFILAVQLPPPRSNDFGGAHTQGTSFCVAGVQFKANDFWNEAQMPKQIVCFLVERPRTCLNSIGPFFARIRDCFGHESAGDSLSSVIRIDCDLVNFEPGAGLSKGAFRYVS